MGKSHRETLAAVTAAVLENQAFMFADLVDNDAAPRLPEDHYVVRMTFAGPVQGRLTMVFPAGMCAEVAANMLGLDEEDELAIAGGQDALKELVNVVCGRLLTEIAGEEPVFDLSVPEISSMDQAAWEGMLGDPETAALLVDEEPVLAHVSCEA
ncbi:MAG: hypothetical protein GWP08_10210 [Nitrospiraceae bacterium]|nr:hypothetical protein [Nitrospiraceae bacterium]